MKSVWKSRAYQLDGNLGFVLLVIAYRQIHCAHAAAAQFGHQAVRPEPPSYGIGDFGSKLRYCAFYLMYGVKDKHYETVGASLLWTLERGPGPDFTPEVMEAWATLYGY